MSERTFIIFFLFWCFYFKTKAQGLHGKKRWKIYKVYSIFFIVFCGAGLYYIPSTTLLLCKNSNFVTKDFMPFLSFLYEVHKVSMHQQKITIASLVQQYIFIRTVSSESEFHAPLHKQLIALQKFNIPIFIDISIKTHQFVCIR